jgi:enoyl-CoA hydratase
MGAPPYVQIRVEGRLGHLTLDRPERINALGPEMIDAISAVLDDWAEDPAVDLVLVDGAGTRGLCAGGDIKDAYQALRAGVTAEAYWAGEYEMDARVAHFPKPYVAFMDGITMGGGIGISGHGSVRIVTERSVLAMPETAIGLVPDVGALYLLARSPGELGTHAAMTGARLDAAHAIHAGLADHLVKSAELPALAEALRDGVAALDAIPAIEPPVVEHRWIDECYRGGDVVDILGRLEVHEHPDAQAAARTIRSMSPIAVVATLRAIRNAATMTVDDVLDQDLRVCSRLMRQPDFAEGVRAQLIDKDRNPRWQPADLADVDPDSIDGLFAPLAR